MHRDFGSQVDQSLFKGLISTKPSQAQYSQNQAANVARINQISGGQQARIHTPCVQNSASSARSSAPYMSMSQKFMMSKAASSAYLSMMTPAPVAKIASRAQIPQMSMGGFKPDFQATQAQSPYKAAMATRTQAIKAAAPKRVKQVTMSAAASGAAKDKQAALWAKITGDQSSGKWPSPAKIFLEAMDPTFEAPGDEMPSGRTKYIHSVGVTGKVRFVKNGDTDYTGIFQGADHGIVRFSSAAEPSSSQALAPGMGLKFLRDGQDSANLVAMFDTAGQPGNWNFFGNDFTTHIPPGKGALLVLATKFATYTNFIQSVGMSDFARYNQAGDMYKDPKFPFSLRFAPHSSVKDLFPTTLPGSDYGVYVDQLKTVKDDSKFYKVYAMDQPAELGGKESYIGDLVLDGALHSSKWGDESLFFRHQNMKDDLKLQPSWEKYTDKFFKLPFTNLAEKCPFGYS